MRPDNRLDPGSGRRCRLAAVVATLSMALAALPAVCLSSAMGSAVWQKVDISAYTTLGILRLKMSTAREESGLRLDEVKIEVDGKPLRIPDGVDVRVGDPRLNEVEIVSTRSITCLDDECPDPTGWPIYIDLTFGRYAASRDGESECEYSLLRFNIDADGFSDVTRWQCVDGRQEERVLYERKDAGKH